MIVVVYMRSVYIHIPFCQTICHYCDFCKLYHNDQLANQYLDQLEQEIKSIYENDLISTIYIGGGTPSCLSLKNLEKLLGLTKIFKVAHDLEFTIECNINDISTDKLLLFKEYGINRISIGIETFNSKFETILNRQIEPNVGLKIDQVHKMGFRNISVDLMYALPNETMADLKNDLNELLKLNITHVSCYSLIIEPHTKLYLNKTKNVDDDLDNMMYNYICKTLKKHGFNHYETSNFAKDPYFSRHNLTYWHNEEYYGFGLGAHGYTNEYRYENTRSIQKYLQGDVRLNTHHVSERENIENELILGLRLMMGINKDHFSHKFKKDIYEVYPIINELVLTGKMIDNGYDLYINEPYIYLANDILINFVGGKYE